MRAFAVAACLFLSTRSFAIARVAWRAHRPRWHHPAEDRLRWV